MHPSYTSDFLMAVIPQVSAAAEAGPGQGQQSTEEACVPSWGSRSVWESNSITVVENKFFDDLSEYLCQLLFPSK